MAANRTDVAVQTVCEEQRVLLRSTWDGYLQILRALGDAPGVRVTYDRGALQIMTTGHEHENLGRLLADLLRVYMDEVGLDFEGGGAETFKRKSDLRGFEPDDCFWIANCRKMLGVKKWNARLHPPPDLAIEVETTHPLIDRLPIYASVGVPEVWRCQTDGLEVLLLQPDGTYRSAPASPTLPDLLVGVVAEHLQMRDHLLSSEIRREFRRWLRQYRAPSIPASPRE